MSLSRDVQTSHVLSEAPEVLKVWAIENTNFHDFSLMPLRKNNVRGQPSTIMTRVPERFRHHAVSHSRALGNVDSALSVR